MKKIIKMIVAITALSFVLCVGAMADSDARSAYLDVINQRIAEHGISPADLPFREIHGVNYADVLDIDGDGSEELVLTYFSATEYEQYTRQEFYLEVWGFDGDTAYKIDSMVYTNGEGAGLHFGEKSVKLLKDDDGNVLFYTCARDSSHNVHNVDLTIDSYAPDVEDLAININISLRGDPFTYFCSVNDVEKVDFNGGILGFDEDTAGMREACSQINDIVSQSLAAYGIDGELVVDSSHGEVAIDDGEFESYNGAVVIYDGYEGYVVDLSIMSELGAKPAKPTAPVAIPYVGVHEDMKLTPAQALAFAEVLDSLSYAKAGLVNGDDNIASLIVENMVYCWDGTSATRASSIAPDTEVIEYIFNEHGVFIHTEYVLGTYNYISHNVYEYHDGVLSDDSVFSFMYSSQDNTTEIGEDIYGVGDNYVEYFGLAEDNFSRTTDFSDDPTKYNGQWLDSAELANLLREYAAANTISYTYPEVADTNFLSDILDELATKYGGELVGVYDLGNGVYYVVIDVSGKQTGNLICTYKENGDVKYRIEETHDEAVSEDELGSIVAEIISRPNVELNFDKVNELETTDEFADYIKDAISNMNGTEINDSSKGELVTFIENAITAPSTVTITGDKNVVKITPDDIKDSMQSANNSLKTYEDLLKSENIELNKDITLIVRIIGNNLDNGEAMEVIFDSALADAIECDILQIYLGSSDHAVQISAENLKTLVAEYGTVSVQIQRNDDGTYTINFLDANREVIAKMVAGVTIFLPCESEYYTVMARYGAESDNWGGQFSAVDKTISFTTKYSGIYELLDNSLNIADITELSDPAQNAIKFMISKGFFTIDENENFRPEDSLLRQDATKALVSMFFTLDRSLTCDFPDVAADSYYYSFVASAAKDSIVLGYDDGEFKGANEMTTEQLLAIVSRTLVDKKSYVYPTEIDTYLGSISGASETSTWAKEAVALAIREGIVLPDESLDPTAPISRGDAALYLYRLFMLLEEVNPVAIEMDITSEPEEVEPETEEKSDGGNSTVIIASVAVVVIAAAGAGFYFIKKK